MGTKNYDKKLSRLWAIYQCLQVGCKLRYGQDFKNHTSLSKKLIIKFSHFLCS
jgi:hypothetical protein